MVLIQGTKCRDDVLGRRRRIPAVAAHAPAAARKSNSNLLFRKTL
jgi:hypothetical protein